MKFIALIFLIYIAFRLISSIFVSILKNKVRKSGMFGNANAEADEPSSNKNKKKIIPKDEGDYVDFEEIDKKSQKP